MSTNDYITDVTANLAEWGIDYRETTEGVSVGNIHLEIAEDGYRPTGTILDGTEAVAITSDADKAAALLAFPLARRAWDLGYAGSFEIDVLGGDLDMRLNFGTSDVTISGDVNASEAFTVSEHPLFRQAVDMEDLGAVITSVELAYSSPEEAWQILCASSDFEHESWQDIVERLNDSVRFYEGDRLTRVESWDTELVVLVEDYNPESPVRVIDVAQATDTTHWSASDVAAAVLCAIA
jgi:hypothetical protein|nr:MAG TPA: hypothetical protein [Caudoviricetes sp.]